MRKRGILIVSIIGIILLMTVSGSVSAAGSESITLPVCSKQHNVTITLYEVNIPGAGSTGKAVIPVWISGQSGSFQLEAKNGIPPYYWAVKPGSQLPGQGKSQGFSLSERGVLSGTAPVLPSGQQTKLSPSFTVMVWDSGTPPTCDEETLTITFEQPGLSTPAITLQQTIVPTPVITTTPSPLPSPTITTIQPLPPSTTTTTIQPTTPPVLAVATSTQTVSVPTIISTTSQNAPIVIPDILGMIIQFLTGWIPKSGTSDQSMLEGQIQYKGTLPPLAPVKYTTREGITLASNFSYQGFVTLLVSETASDTDVRDAVASLGGSVIDAIPKVGIYTIQVPPEHIAALIDELQKKSFVIDAAPSSPIIAKNIQGTRLSVLDSNSGETNDECLRQHGDKVTYIARGTSNLPVKFIDTNTQELQSATYPLKGLKVVGNWYPILGRQIISEMEDASHSKERITISLSLGSIADGEMREYSIKEGCNNPTTSGALTCKIIQQEQLIFFKQIYQTLARSPPEIRKNTAIVVAAGNAGVDLTSQLNELHKQYRDAAKSILIVGGTNVQNKIDTTMNFASSGMVYDLSEAAISGTDITCKGTSFATPDVANVYRQMWAANPELTSDQVQRAFIDSLGTCPGASSSSNIVPTIDGITSQDFIDCSIKKAKEMVTPSKTITNSVQPSSTPTITPTLAYAKTFLEESTAGTPAPLDLLTYQPLCTVNQMCDVKIGEAIGGSPPYTYRLDSSSGEYPLGTILWPKSETMGGPSVAMLRGTPGKDGTYHFKICVSDLSGQEVCRDAILTVEKSKETTQTEVTQTEKEPVCQLHITTNCRWGGTYEYWIDRSNNGMADINGVGNAIVNLNNYHPYWQGNMVNVQVVGAESLPPGCSGPNPYIAAKLICNGEIITSGETNEPFSGLMLGPSLRELDYTSQIQIPKPQSV